MFTVRCICVVDSSDISSTDVFVGRPLHGYFTPSLLQIKKSQPIVVTHPEMMKKEPEEVPTPQC